ncbi:hypothetical protein HDU84_000744 [Entophlyctis sp. JEL0112]|nr:hypothetical protein HDU84_000744 [Entophlyctis sp. JEL0112]
MGFHSLRMVTNATQQFALDAAGKMHVQADPTLCFGATATEKGQTVYLAPCTSAQAIVWTIEAPYNDPNQQDSLVKNPLIGPFWHPNGNSALCLDCYNGILSSGNPIARVRGAVDHNIDVDMLRTSCVSYSVYYGDRDSNLKCGGNATRRSDNINKALRADCNSRRHRQPHVVSMGKRQVQHEALNARPTPAHSLQRFARVTSVRGGGLYDVLTAVRDVAQPGAATEEPATEPALVQLPSKFKKILWIKLGSFVLVEMIVDSSTKIRGDILAVLRPDHVKEMRAAGDWPCAIDPAQSALSARPTNAVDVEADSETLEEDDDIFVNRNRMHVEYETDESESD